MARGALKSDVISAQAAKRSPILSLDERVAILDGASARLKKDETLHTTARVRAFSDAVAEYTSHTHSENEGHKERKQAIIDAYAVLPKYIRDAISLASEPIKKLYRGGNHPSNPGPDGKIHASFTSDEEVAEGFADIVSNGRVYSGKDIASHGPIINIKAFGHIREAFGEYDPPEKHTQNLFGDFTYTALISEEDEHIVTNIKWKPSASERPAGKVRGYLNPGPWKNED